MFGNVPNLGELFIWVVLLQLRLDRRRSGSTVAGWRVVDRDDERIRLAAASWFMTANLVVRAGDNRVSLDTLIDSDRWAAYVIWPPLSAIHRALIPGVLRKAAARVAGDPAAALETAAKVAATQTGTAAVNIPALPPRPRAAAWPLPSGRTGWVGRGATGRR
jgi:hypothetical protein